MPKKHNFAHQHDLYENLELIFRRTFPLTIGALLLIGGIWLLSLPLPGWKLILGLPSAQLGIVILMFAFDDITKKTLHPYNYRVQICPFCSFENLIHSNQKKIHCGNCQKQITIPDEINGEE